MGKIKEIGGEGDSVLHSRFGRLRKSTRMRQRAVNSNNNSQDSGDGRGRDCRSNGRLVAWATLRERAAYPTALPLQVI